MVAGQVGPFQISSSNPLDGPAISRDRTLVSQIDEPMRGELGCITSTLFEQWFNRQTPSQQRAIVLEEEVEMVALCRVFGGLVEQDRELHGNSILGESSGESQSEFRRDDFREFLDDLF